MSFHTNTISSSPCTLSRWRSKYPRSAWFYLSLKAFDRESPARNLFGIASRLRKEVAEGDFRKLFNHLPKGKHLTIVLGLDRSERCGNCRCYYACYRLLEGGIHDLGVSCDFFEMWNCFRELVYVCELGRVVKGQRLLSYSCTILKQSRLQKKRRYKEVDKGLQA